MGGVRRRDRSVDAVRIMPPKFFVDFSNQEKIRRHSFSNSSSETVHLWYVRLPSDITSRNSPDPRPNPIDKPFRLSSD